MTLEERYRITDKVKEVFFSKLVYNPMSHCWEWTGLLDKDGYGIYGYARRGAKTTHRLSFLIFKGEIPQFASILHSCDNRKCCNPFHLFIGSLTDNVNDRQSKQRHAFGERIGTSFITDKEVVEIRRLYKEELISQKQLALQFNCSVSCISHIITGRNRKLTEQFLL